MEAGEFGDVIIDNSQNFLIQPMNQKEYDQFNLPFNILNFQEKKNEIKIVPFGNFPQTSFGEFSFPKDFS